MSALTWPPGLSAETPLPYAFWRVLNHIDGQRDLLQVARLSQVSPSEVQHQLDEVQRWLSRAAQREQPVTEQLASQVAQCLTAVVGPVAALMVDEVRDDLGQKATLSALLSGLAEQLNAERVQQFARQLHDRGLA